VISNRAHGDVYSIQQYAIQFVRDLRQIGGFLRVLPFSTSNEKNCVRNSFWIFLQFLIYSVTFFFYTKYHYEKHILLEISRLNLHKCQASELHLLRIYTFMFHCAWKFNTFRVLPFSTSNKTDCHYYCAWKFNTSCQNCIWLFQDLHTHIEGKGYGV
jgi:hypothetical protein